MAAKEVKFSVEARDKMLRGIDILANAVRVTWRFGGGDRDGWACRQEAWRWADGALRLSGGAGERCRARGASGARNSARAGRAQPQECRNRRPGTRPHRLRSWASSGRCGGRDFR